jgi:hypothetical protein
MIIRDRPNSQQSSSKIDLIQMPLITSLRAPKLIGVLLTELPAPLADRLIRHDDPTGERQFFDTR